ncbi:MAG: magnesium chelatase [Chloroflexi bacterium HGW-Chloroflexi-2]|jgi:magnesium chelatase subunit I|nr:MAG: magnesium chelatase [Chloroflexi bacterium HGW-Chloroflexi-2]
MSLDNFEEHNPGKSETPHVNNTNIRSLKELIDIASGKNISHYDFQHDSGIAEPLFYPFLGIVGQYEMKLALILTIINPNIGGVLLIGPRGTAKTTSVKGLVDILPFVESSSCQFGCLPEHIDVNGIDGVCPECAQKYAENISISEFSKVKIIELPLNTDLESVTGSIDEIYHKNNKMHLKRGILSLADKNILYIDEVNLLSNETINSILDAAAMGKYTVRSASLSSTFRSRFTLIGSMNPEEGNLRPQIMDRFGLRVVTRGLDNDADRLEAYFRVSHYLSNPYEFIQIYRDENNIARQEIENARKFVWKVKIDSKIAKYGIELIKDLNIHSLRAELTLFEAAKALAASENRDQITIEDIKSIAPMALRLRRSTYINNFIENNEAENEEINSVLDKILE